MTDLTRPNAQPSTPVGHPDSLGELAARIGLPGLALSQLQQVLGSEQGVQKAILYGSRAMGNFRPGSDIDLCLMAPTLTLSDQFALENRIDDLLLPWKVDMSMHHAIDNPELLDHIARVGLVLYPFAPT